MVVMTMNPCILELKVDIGDDNQKTLFVHKNDISSVIACKFISENNLPEEIIDSLTAKIDEERALISIHNNISNNHSHGEISEYDDKYFKDRNGDTIIRKTKVAKQATFDRLYSAAKTKADYLEKIGREAKTEQEQAELIGCTFKPKITESAKQNPGGRLRGRGYDAEMRRYNDSLSQRDRMKQIQDENRFTKNCSFKPEICSRSKVLANATDAPSEPRYDRLYREALARQARREKMANTPQYPFQPDRIASYDPELLYSHYQLEFWKRLVEPCLPDTKLAKLQSKYLDHDPETGAPRFQPEASRAPKPGWARPESVSVSDYLYYSRHPSTDKRKNQESPENTEVRTMMTPKSKQLAEDIKEQTFRKLWTKLREIHTENADAQEMEREKHKITCLVDFLPEILLTKIGSDPILEKSQGSLEEFQDFMKQQCHKMPLVTGLRRSNVLMDLIS